MSKIDLIVPDVRNGRGVKFFLQRKTYTREVNQK